MKNTILISILLIFVSCNKETYEVTNLNGNKITVIGHGGMGVGKVYPLNSLESFLKCLAVGADGIEIDVQMTKDLELVAYHDQLLETKTNMNGKVNISEMKDLKKANYTNYMFTQYKVVTLHDIFSAIDNIHHYTYVFDCKLYPYGNLTTEYLQDFANAIIQIIDRYDIANNVLIESTSVDLLQILQNIRPEFKLFIYPADFDSGFQTAKEMNLYGITISSAKITEEQVRMAHEQNIRVAVWNVQNRSQAVSAIKKNPDYIQADNVKTLIKLLSK
jgi:glycerophosphoryl diester phosphodiesterase